MQINNLNKEDWKACLSDDTAVILDVRTPQEWQEGIIPGAVTIDVMRGQAFVYDLEKLDKDKAYYVYCRSGGRSGQACSIMQQLGFERTYNLIGGIMEWDGEIVKP